jgi:hypothetical protein
VWQEWEAGELLASWTLAGDDWRLVGNKSGPTRPGFVTSAAASRRTPGAKPPAAPGRTDFSRSRRLS